MRDSIEFDGDKKPTREDIKKVVLVEHRYCPNDHGPLEASIEGYECSECDFKLIMMMEEDH